MTEWVLGVESSCDDTGLGLLSEDGELVHVRDQQSHTQTGGVVPQIAAANHLERISPLFDSLLDKAGAKASDLVALGVTEGPGLAGSLAVGVSWTLGLGEALGLPVWGVHHLEAHTHTLLTGGEEAPKEYPLLVLLVSGGHTSLLHWDGTSTPQSVLATLDDAAGEAIDKVARHLGLGGPLGPPREAGAEEVGVASWRERWQVAVVPLLWTRRLMGVRRECGEG
ncbi:hypothetical protein H8D30_06625, partial [bacterium]|nr:hypothetical protein [bacterium]